MAESTTHPRWTDERLDDAVRDLRGDIQEGRKEAREAHRRLGEKLDGLGSRIGELEASRLREEGAERERGKLGRMIVAAASVAGVAAATASTALDKL